MTEHSKATATAAVGGTSRHVATEHASALFEVGCLWEGPTTRANAMTCDVEDYFHVSAFAGVIPEEQWDSFEARIPRNVDLVLQLFADAGVHATFFTLGWVAERLPDVVRRIADAGHEVASHGMRHRRVWQQQPEEFREDAARAKALLEDVSGCRVRGYRAASWSIDTRTPWAYTVLGEIGYDYSSSIYPIAHDHYGMPAAPRQPFFERTTGLLEIPATTVAFAGRNWPAAGGGYFRLMPLPISLWLLSRASREAPAVFYFHPWELDPTQPRVAEASRRARFRHYHNLGKFETRLKALLDRFEWDRVDTVFLEHSQSRSSSEPLSADALR